MHKLCVRHLSLRPKFIIKTCGLIFLYFLTLIFQHYFFCTGSCLFIFFILISYHCFSKRDEGLKMTEQIGKVAKNYFKTCDIQITINFLTAACCPKRDFYTPPPHTKMETDFCNERPKRFILPKAYSKHSLSYFLSFKHTFSVFSVLSQTFSVLRTLSQAFSAFSTLFQLSGTFLYFLSY